MIFVEIIGFIAGVGSVWLAARENKWNWPVGIINVTAYAILFFQSKLYGDMVLQLVYIVMALYGWYAWNKKIRSNALQITSCKKRFWISITALAFILFFLILFFLKKTDSNTPYLDALTTTLSLVAAWMMARKYIEHWIVWISVNIVYIGLYLYKELYLTGVLYFIFMILAINGFLKWRKKMKTQPA